MLVGLRHPRTRSSAFLPALLVALLLVLLAGCSQEPDPGDSVLGPPATASPETTPAARPAPEVGACHRLSLAQARTATTTTPPVPCDGTHTAYTFHVGRFAEEAMTADAGLARRACTRHLAEGVGLSRTALPGTVIDWVWFEPTTEQWAAGSRWFRCDAIARTEDRLHPLPAAAPPFPDGDVPAAWRRCIAVDDAELRVGHTVTCDRPHDYRFAGTFRAADAPQWPGTAAFRAAAGRRCPEITGAAAWWATWPLAEAWAQGARRVSCFRPA